MTGNVLYNSGTITHADLERLAYRYSMMRRFCVSIVIGMAVCMNGCAVVNPVATPRAQVMAVTLEEQAEEGTRLLVSVELTNPNDVDLPLVGAHYTVSVGGVRGAFDDKPNRTLPAGGRQTIELPAAVVLARDAFNLGEATYAVRGAIRYEPPGEIRKLLTEAGVPLPEAQFSDSGELAE